jgi:hypothetical protein
MRNPSQMAHQFSRVPKAEIPRAQFNRSHSHKTTFDAGYLVPILVDEALPGDTFNLNMTGFCRLNTPEFPIMDNMFMETFFFAVPNRLLWDNWERFCGAQDDPGDSIDFTVPTITSFTNPTSGLNTTEQLFDYLGAPMGVAIDDMSQLPARAYNLIYNEWFRDQNLQDSANVLTGNGPNSASNFYLRRRGKRHDYFTSCLPWPQKGDSIDLPLGTSAPVATDAVFGTDLTIYSTVEDNNQRMNSAGTYLENVTGDYSGGALYADLSTATAATINQLRQAFQIQKLLERDARGGTRYTEVIRAHFGVTSPDARLQRPEFLGGGSSPVNITPIAQTSESNTTAQGTLAGFGTASLRGHGFTASFTEHCQIIGLVNVRADLTYQQGLERQFLRSTRYDYYWPALAFIGEQAVTNAEIYYQGTSQDDDVFGYQERYAEYRYKPSRLSGLMRSEHATSLDAWHLSQDFLSLPSLNSGFIVEDPPISRVVAVSSEPDFIGDFFFDMKCARGMPLYGVPSNIDRF